MKCKLSEKCEFGNLCKDATRHDSLTVLGCSSFKTKEPLTNEERIKQCTTEQLAEWIADKSNEIISWILAEVDEHDGECIDEDDYWQKKSDFVEWLKEVHQ